MKLLIVLFAVFVLTYGRPNGAPIEACRDLKPMHNDTKPSTAPSPFSILIEPEVMFQGGDVLVEIVTTGTPIKGFILQAREVFAIYRTFGKFRQEDLVELDFHEEDCLHEQDTVTHSRRLSKSRQRLIFEVPKDYVGPLTIGGTVVEDFNNYWSDLRSQTLIVLPLPKENATLTEQ